MGIWKEYDYKYTDEYPDYMDLDYKYKSFPKYQEFNEPYYLEKNQNSQYFYEPQPLKPRNCILSGFYKSFKLKANIKFFFESLTLNLI